jgi:hypothetical protein
VAFHARRPLLSESVMQGGTAYSPLVTQPVDVSGIQAFSVIDTTALFGVGADFPGTASVFHFVNWVPASGGSATNTGGWWLTWNFPFTNPVTAPPGAVGAGMTLNNSFVQTGVIQYGGTGHNNCPWYLDLVSTGGSGNTWKPSFYWLTPSTPVINGNSTDTAGQTTRMGFLWQSVAASGTTVSAVPSVSASWGTVTSAALNTMGSALTLLNNPPTLRASTTSGQSFGDATITIAGLHNTPDVDNYAGWSTAISNYTVPLPGLYLFSPTLVWGTASAANDRWCGLQVTAGGTTVNYQGPAYAATPVGPGTTGTGLTATSVARILSLNAGDKVAAYGYQNSGAALSLYTGYETRLIGAYMTPQAAAGTTVSYTAPVTGYRFQAGALQGTALAATLASRIGNDVGFLLNKPYFTGWQGTSQSGFANNGGFQKVTIDTPGALPRGGNGDNWGGWSASNHWYVSQLAGWYLVMFDGYATPPAATTATLTAGIYCSSSGGIAPSSTPDQYQQVFYPVSTGGPPPGAFAMGMYYLQPNEYVYPVLQAQNWGGTWGTFMQTGSVPVNSQFSVFLASL